MDVTENTIPAVKTVTYTQPAPDTSNIVAEVVDSTNATITYGGSALIIPVWALDDLVTLAQGVRQANPAAYVPPADPEPDPTPTETPAS